MKRAVREMCDLEDAALEAMEEARAHLDSIGAALPGAAATPHATTPAQPAVEALPKLRLPSFD